MTDAAPEGEVYDSVDALAESTGDDDDTWSIPDEWADPFYGIEYASDDDGGGSFVGVHDCGISSAECGDDGGDDDAQCPICLDRLCPDAADNAPASIVACGHTFHFACIAEWARGSMSCPLCKAPIDETHDAAVHQRATELASLIYVPWLDDADEAPYALTPDDNADAHRMLSCLTPGCGELVLGADMRDHYARVCAPRRCEDCGATTTAALIERHLSLQCPRRWMRCPAGTCTEVIVHEAWKAVHDDHGRSTAPVTIGGAVYASAAQYLVDDHRCAAVVKCGVCARVYRNDDMLNVHCIAVHTAEDVCRALPPRRPRSAAKRARQYMIGSNVSVRGGDFVRNWTV